jgi:hypothetical protein
LVFFSSSSTDWYNKPSSVVSFNYVFTVFYYCPRQYCVQQRDD